MPGAVWSEHPSSHPRGRRAPSPPAEGALKQGLRRGAAQNGCQAAEGRLRSWGSGPRGQAGRAAGVSMAQRLPSGGKAPPRQKLTMSPRGASPCGRCGCESGARGSGCLVSGSVGSGRLLSGSEGSGRLGLRGEQASRAQRGAGVSGSVASDVSEPSTRGRLLGSEPTDTATSGSTSTRLTLHGPHSPPRPWAQAAGPHPLRTPLTNSQAAALEGGGMSYPRSGVGKTPALDGTGRRCSRTRPCNSSAGAHCPD